MKKKRKTRSRCEPMMHPQLDNQIIKDGFDVNVEDDVQRNPAIAHFKGPADFIPYCERCLIANI